jgi:glycine C-acetyltransferase
MKQTFYSCVDAELASFKIEGTAKAERVILSAQGSTVKLANADEQHSVLNFCSNNYLGLASDPRVISAACQAAERWGAGLASVRFICGTQAIHKDLEAITAEYLGFEDSILFAAAFDANAAVFEPLLGPDDAIISDALNHASLIDGIRLSKARRFRFASGDMDDLERVLKLARQEGAKSIMIATDGVFSMDGTIANLTQIVDLADRYGALTLVDDCHATGVLGAGGAGSASFRNVAGRIDIVTGTYGKALGGAMGGFVAARRPVVELLRQRARPYLFSNSLAPALCGAAIAAIEIARSNSGDALRSQLFSNAVRFRTGLARLGFELTPGEHPIIPVILGDAKMAQAMAEELLLNGVYVTGFSFPVVPRGMARIRTQMSAAHTTDDIDQAIKAFKATGRKLEII